MDEDAARIDALVSQATRTNDVDVKVDALSKLQAEFERRIQIQDSESILSLLKTCLRTSNQHLTSAAVSAIPPLLPLLVSHAPPVTQIPSPTASTSTSSISASTSMDIFVLRQVLNAFLPSGGLIERLGDREKIQSKARESLVILGGLVFRTGGSSSMSKSTKSGAETPLMVFERFLREAGFGSKVWKVREQSILVLAEIRRQHHLFPLKPYLPLLVTSLEDTDAHVRDCARKSVIEIFSGPGVTDAARADLKKEMTKKGVRKTIVDSVLGQVLGGGGSGSSAPPSREGSENGDAKPAYVPPSLALQNRKTSGPVPVRTVSGSVPRPASVAGSRIPSRPESRAGSELPMTPTADTADIPSVFIASSRDLENEFAGMGKAFEGKESEHNWADRERSIVRVRGMVKGEVHTRYMETFLACLKDEFIKWSLKGLASLRTTLSSHSCSLYGELAVGLGHAFDPFCEIMYTNLLKMAGFTKKIIAQLSQTTVTTIMINTSAQPRLLVPLLWQGVQEKNVQSRQYAAGHVKTFLEVHGQRSKHAIESTGTRETLERALKKGLGDPNPAVREAIRSAFWAFHGIWSDRGTALIATLDSTSRKQLERACPNPEAISTIASATPTPTSSAPKKSSVAAAIAASRAKAKAIATSPPSLRHQATSATHVPGAAVRRPSSPSHPRPTTSRPSSPLRMASSPSTSPSTSRVIPHTSTSPKATPSSPGGYVSPYKSTPSSPPRPSVSAHSRTTSGSSKGRAESPTGNRSTGRRLSSPLAFASNTSPSKRASIIRQSLVGTSNVGNGNGHAPPHGPPSPPESRTSPTPRLRTTSGSNGRAAAIPVKTHQTNGDDFLVPLKLSQDDSLLLAQAIPVPDEDSDTDDDNLMSFSAPFEIAKAEAASRHSTPGRARTGSARGFASPPRSNSQVRSASPKSLPSRGPLSPGAGHPPDGPGDQSLVVEDALRATAEQAESAAERLLEELVDPEDSNIHSPIPPALLLGNGVKNGVVPSTPAKAPAKVAPLTSAKVADPPTTPLNNRSDVLRQAALFKNSPAYNGRASSLIDLLSDTKQDSAWWLKRKAIVAQKSQLRLAKTDPVEKLTELQQFISALDQDTADVTSLQRLAVLCMENPTVLSSPPVSPGYEYPISPSPSSSSVPSLVSDIWDQNRNFDRLFNALVKYLDPRKDETLLQYGLIVLWELMEHQASHIEGREGEVFTALLHIRYCNKINVLEATNVIRDSLTSSTEPVYGLTTIHGSLRAFLAETLPTIEPLSPGEISAARTHSTAFALLALGKFILRLPSEILEEELPRLRPTLIASLNETTVQGGLVVREAAAAAIIAAQLVLRDEGNLFVLLDGLRDDKKNLLTYLFDKHGVRGNSGVPQPGSADGGLERLEKEMRRLDTRTSTPPRIPLATASS